MGVTIREWKGAWWIFINHHGTRKAKRIGTGAVGKKAAKQAVQQIQARLALGQTAFDHPQTSVTLDAYVETFLERIEQTRKHTTHTDYRKIFGHYVFPVFRGQDLQQITREKVKAFAVGCLQRGLSAKTVQNSIRTLSSLFSHAIEDNLIIANPALRPGKFLPKISKRRSINPLTREELALFLTHTKTVAPKKAVNLDVWTSHENSPPPSRHCSSIGGLKRPHVEGRKSLHGSFVTSRAIH